MKSQTEDPESSVRSCLREKEKNVSNRDWDRVIIHVVTNTIVASSRKKNNLFPTIVRN